LNLEVLSTFIARVDTKIQTEPHNTDLRYK